MQFEFMLSHKTQQLKLVGSHGRLMGVVPVSTPERSSLVAASVTPSEPHRSAEPDQGPRPVAAARRARLDEEQRLPAAVRARPCWERRSRVVGPHPVEDVQGERLLHGHPAAAATVTLLGSRACRATPRRDRPRREGSLYSAVVATQFVTATCN